MNMWGTLAKIGASIVAGLGIDWAYDSVKESQAEAKEQAQMEKQAKWGKWLLIGAMVFLGYSVMSKRK